VIEKTVIDMNSSNLYLFRFFLLEYHVGFMVFWYVPTFSGKNLGHKSRSSYILVRVLLFMVVSCCS